jgi:hypothetical protein
MQCPPIPGPGIEFHEPERLRRRGLDHFPDVDAELVAHDGHLVHEADVHRAEGVLEGLVSSAASGDDTRTVVSMQLVYSAIASSVQFAVMPPTTLGVFFVW